AEPVRPGAEPAIAAVLFPLAPTRHATSEWFAIVEAASPSRRAFGAPQDEAELAQNLLPTLRSPRKRPPRLAQRAKRARPRRRNKINPFTDAWRRHPP